MQILCVVVFILAHIYGTGHRHFFNALTLERLLHYLQFLVTSHPFPNKLPDTASSLSLTSPIPFAGCDHWEAPGLGKSYHSCGNDGYCYRVLSRARLRGRRLCIHCPLNPCDSPIRAMIPENLEARTDNGDLAKATLQTSSRNGIET